MDTKHTTHKYNTADFKKKKMSISGGLTRLFEERMHGTRKGT